MASKLPLKFRHFFSASTFLKFDRDEYGRIDMQSFFHSIVRKNNLFQTRIHISLYDTCGNGYLTEANLREYISELIPTFTHLRNIEEDFKDFYIIGAMKKFTFFLDPKRTGRVYIKDMLTSPILAELYELRQERYEEEVNQNWYSIINIGFQFLMQKISIIGFKNSTAIRTKLSAKKTWLNILKV